MTLVIFNFLLPVVLVIPHYHPAFMPSSSTSEVEDSVTPKQSQRSLLLSSVEPPVPAEVVVVMSSERAQGGGREQYHRRDDTTPCVPVRMVLTCTAPRTCRAPRWHGLDQRDVRASW